jgi:modification methylase
VLDPDCGAGTVLVEALRAGRHAIGATSRSRWWRVARANVTAAKREGAGPDGMVLDAPPGAALARLAAPPRCIDLVLTTWRHTRTKEPTSLAAAGALEASSLRLRRMLTRCQPLVRPGGHVIVVAPRRHGLLVDSASRVLEVGCAAGLVPVERCIALVAELRGSRLVAPASLGRRRAAARDERSTGHPLTLAAHLEVLIFQATLPPAAAQAGQPDRPLGGIDDALVSHAIAA